jgi:hypothetical protein
MDDINKQYKRIKPAGLYDIYSPFPDTFVPRPTENEYLRGYINRYFLQRVNDQASPILEVSNIEYARLSSNSLYARTSLRWRITGPKESVYDQTTGKLIDMGVRQSNTKSIELASGPIPNLKLHLPDLTKFWKKV